MVSAPSAAIGIGAGPGNSVGIRVLTIVITAPQQEQMIGGRCLHHGSACAGSNFSSRCSKAIRRLQLGCRKPKLRARRNPLGSTCCSTSHKKVRAGHGPTLHLPGLGVAIAEAHLTVARKRRYPSRR